MATVSPSTYDEELIVSLVSDIYDTLIHFGHLEENEVTWPPAEGHHLDLSQLDDSVRIDQGALSLMQRLPLPTEPSDKPLAI